MWADTHMGHPEKAGDWKIYSLHPLHPVHLMDVGFRLIQFMFDLPNSMEKHLNNSLFMHHIIPVLQLFLQLACPFCNAPEVVYSMFSSYITHSFMFPGSWVDLHKRPLVVNNERLLTEQNFREHFHKIVWMGDQRPFSRHHSFPTLYKAACHHHLAEIVAETFLSAVTSELHTHVVQQGEFNQAPHKIFDMLWKHLHCREHALHTSLFSIFLLWFVPDKTALSCSLLQVFFIFNVC